MGPRSRSALTAAALALLCAAPSRAEGPVQASGYLKELWQSSRTLLDRRPYWLSTTRARVTLEGAAGGFKARADYDHELLAGTFFRRLDYAAFGLAEPASFLDLEQELSTGPASVWRHRLYRAWAGWEGERALVRFGRQRIAWGTGKLWNPTDLLNPYQPLSVERDQRRGVDALYARAGLGDLSQAELAWAPRPRWPDHALLARGRTNWRDFDLSLLGGKIAASTASWAAGGDFAGNLAGGTLHGEWLYADPRSRDAYWKAGLGYDYDFSREHPLAPLREAAVVVEYLHSGAGAFAPEDYDFAALREGREVAAGRDYAGASWSKDVHPLVKLELSAIVNLRDRSHFLSPSAQWNALKDLYLSGGVQRFGGTPRSEFGRLPNIAFAQAQYFF